MGIGSDGISPAWAYGPGYSDQPQYTTDPTAADMQTIEQDSAPYPVELQPYASMTQYCWNSTHDGLFQTSLYNGNYCVPDTYLDAAPALHPQGLPECVTTPSDCLDDPSDTLDINQTYIGQCARWNVQEISYLGQQWYRFDDFEVYHSDLDDVSKAAIESSGLSLDTQNLPTPSSTTLLGVQNTLQELVAGGNSSVPEPWTAYLTSDNATDYPCPKVEP